MRLCREVDENPSISHKRPWLDQLALPLAIHRLGWTFTCLSEQWNYPAHLRTMPHDMRTSPFVVHYHHAEVIAHAPSLLSHVQMLAGTYSALGAVLRTFPHWTHLLAPAPLDSP